MFCGVLLFTFRFTFLTTFMDFIYGVVSLHGLIYGRFLKGKIMYVIVNIYIYLRKSKRFSYLKISPPKAPFLSPIPYVEFVSVKVK